MSSNSPMSPAQVNNVIDAIRTQMADVATHPNHEYTDKALNLANILIEKIGKMTPIELDALLHPLF